MSNINNSQNYISRDYQTIRAELMELLKVHFPDQYQDFNSVSIGMSLVELLAYVSDLLSYHTDKKFNELFLDGVSERTSVFRLAKTLGYKPVGYRPAITIADITCEVPTTASGPDYDYLPLIRSGMQIKGNSQVFETINDSNFASDFSEDGVANRKIEPIFNSNQDILRYRITKREKIKAGSTIVYKQEISSDDAAKAFFDVYLPQKDVLEIISVIVKPGVSLVTPPTYTEFNDNDIRYYEVDELAQKTVFVDDDTEPTVNGIKAGHYLEVPQRFIKEFMADGSCKLTFGGGTPDYNAYEYYLSNLAVDENSIDLGDIFNNSALGTKLPANSTLYVKYRIGGGTLSNVGANVLSQVGNVDSVIIGSDATSVQSVVNSIKALNPLPALGGADLQTVEEIKYNIASNFASQKRCVTLDDYISRAYQIPGRFGAPFRIHGKVEDNKVKLYVLSKGADGKLVSSSTSIIKNNLVEYLIPYRMINDFVEINDGKVVNIQIEVDLFTDKTYNSNEVKLNAINAIKDYFDLDKWQFNQHIYVSQLVDILREVPGIINVVDIRIYNLEGGDYSTVLTSQATGQRTSILNTGVFRTQMEYINNAIFSTPISMFEVKFPEKDILCRVA
jgi:hypothetical protein